MTPLVVENEPPVTFLRRKMTGGRFSMGVVIRRYTGSYATATVSLKNGCQNFSYVHSGRKHKKCKEHVARLMNIGLHHFIVLILILHVL